MPFVRGQVYFCDLGYGEKPWLVVSNNARNRALGSALVARITTSRKPPLESIVQLQHDDVLAGSVLCDDIETIYADDDLRRAGALTLDTMVKVDRALKVAFRVN
ncbi:hypothetical protein BKD30_12170 [Tersicoccus phoenicis]|uniref:MazF family transcriptional regulator n=1 Tax=Tersicoccus phoenicis TaxID=554083 RepID=A0A1R1L7X9_9MICC|nr:type II toxin-antitoxin system PemK/MazF family toxin [Tersicoccus phoenicis]OMH23638.1 hypothetical protein BKD30_12170 [Tersicoccus phoenicis]